MKTSTIVLAGVAVFGGVLGAMQADRWLDRRESLGPVANVVSTPNLQPIQYEGGVSQPFDFRQASKKVSPSVVSVDRFGRVQQGMFEEESVEAKTGTGSGVVLSKEGIIVTNNHVVAGADKVNVRLSDGRTLEAKVVGLDPRSDLAVLKVSAPNLTPIEVGKSTDVQVGQWVLAVGNPLGFDNTVSVGVVSSLKRNLPVGGSGLVDAIQTDAAINPGNSGGALTDAQGRLIGINSAIASSTGQSVGIGFSIPVDRVKKVVNDIVEHGAARYAGLGVSFTPYPLADPRVRYALAERYGLNDLPNKGVLITGLTENSRKAGIKQYDVILAVNDQEIEGSFDLNRVLTPRKPGDSVKMKLWSEGKTRTVSLPLIEIESR
ncbi:trypsin-like serine protease [bacterium]|nr:MAG: trypsin-like serine protease [bacterium]